MQFDHTSVTGISKNRCKIESNHDRSTCS